MVLSSISVTNRTPHCSIFYEILFQNILVPPLENSSLWSVKLGRCLLHTIFLSWKFTTHISMKILRNPTIKNHGFNLAFSILKSVHGVLFQHLIIAPKKCSININLRNDVTATMKLVCFLLHSSINLVVSFSN